MSSDYGPVPVSRMKPESTRIFDALAGGRRVLISKNGQVAAVIDPPALVPRELLIDYAIPVELGLPELTATDINQGSPSSAVTAAVEGSPYLVTRDHEVYGFLRGITDDDVIASVPTSEEDAEYERQIEEFLAQHPAADAAEVAAFSEQLEQELTSTRIRAGDIAAIAKRIRSMAHEYAQDAAFALGEPVAVSEASRAVFASTLEARTIEAIVGLTNETIAIVTHRAFRAHGAFEDDMERVRQRANAAIERLEKGVSA